MYKALENIGDYKKGEEVPEDKAKLWMGMYKNSPVEEVGKDSEDSESKESDKSDSNDSMLEDYLGRNKSVVKKNVEKDDLSKDQMEKLLKLEKSDKNREDVVKALEKRLGDLK